MLIADDEDDVHRVTKLALDNFVLEGRPIRFIDVYSGAAAVAALAEQPDIAMVLMDVVMETETAGLQAVEAIRSKLRNEMVRIVVRTGHPGQAPARDVVTRYDINDYKEKTELTAEKLFATVYTSLNLYEDLTATRKSRDALSRIADASSTILRRRLPERLARGSLQLLASVLGVNQAAKPPAFGAIMVAGPEGPHASVLAAIGRFSQLEGKVNPPLLARLEHLGKTHGPKPWVRGARFFAARLTGAKDTPVAVYLQADHRIPAVDVHVLDVLCRTVAAALHVAQLNRDLYKTQYDLVALLSEAIERRSLETGNHVRRVGEFSRLLARLYGLDRDDCDQLLVASALHDAGKIAIPDAILTKPGPLTPAERVVMEKHAEIGADMFAGKDLAVLKAAEIIAREHHERWDGLGYPRKLKGTGIHVYGRIVALADVFDALGSRRCYKKAWPLADVKKALIDERGRHFEPRLVDLLLRNLDEFLAIRQRLADPEPLSHPA